MWRLWQAKLNCAAIAERLGLTVPQVTVCLRKLRRRGVPVHRNRPVNPVLPSGGAGLLRVSGDLSGATTVGPSHDNSADAGLGWRSVCTG